MSLLVISGGLIDQFLDVAICKPDKDKLIMTSLRMFSVRISMCPFYNKLFSSGIVVTGYLQTKPSHT
jgi:hypothetical protein